MSYRKTCTVLRALLLRAIGGYDKKKSTNSEIILNFGDQEGSAPLNSLPNDKILALTKLKAFADDKFSVA